MGDETSLIDLLFLGGALVLIILTSAGIGRRRSKPAEGQRMATFGMLVWLLLLGLAFYLIFG